MRTAITRRDTSRGRYYTLSDGSVYPSVTTILGVINKPALLSWYAKMEREMVIEAAANLYDDAPGEPKMKRAAFVATLESRIGKEKAAKKELAKAAELGTQAHALIEWNLRKELGQEVGPEPRIGDKAAWAFMAWEDWRKSVNLKPLLVEQIVYSRTHKYAGTLDLLAELDLAPYGRTKVVIDWKTGKAIYWEAKLQNVAYAAAVEEMGHAKGLTPGLVVRLPKVETDPEFETMPIHIQDHGELFSQFLAARNLFLGMEAWEAQRKKAI